MLKLGQEKRNMKLLNRLEKATVENLSVSELFTVLHGRFILTNGFSFLMKEDVKLMKECLDDEETATC